MPKEEGVEKNIPGRGKTFPQWLTKLHKQQHMLRGQNKQHLFFVYIDSQIAAPNVDKTELKSQENFKVTKNGKCHAGAWYLVAGNV